MSDSDLQLVRERLAAIAEEQARLEAEKAELAITERVLARLQATRSTGQPVRRLRLIRRSSATPPRVQSDLTQIDLIVGTLKAAADPWVATANTLQTMIKDLHGVEIKMNSLHPLLSDLKGQGVIKRAGFKIALASRVAEPQEVAAE